MEYNSVLAQALSLAKERRPDASIQKQAAFAAGVLYLTAGVAGGYGGPRVREHAVSYLYGGALYSFEEAVNLLLDESGPVFGSLTEVHKRCWLEQYCFDDDPQDVAELVRLTGWQR